MKKISFFSLLLAGFSIGWFVLLVATELYESLTKFGVQFVCCENTTTVAKASLVFSYFLVLATCLFLSYLVNKSYSFVFSCSIGIGVIASIFLKFHVHETPFNLWLESPFIEATFTAICIPILTWVLSSYWLTHHSSGTPNGAP